MSLAAVMMVVTGGAGRRDDAGSRNASCISVNMLIRLFSPIRYPSSWFPTTHFNECEMDIPFGKTNVLAKSISHTLALVLSWTNSRELPIT